MGQSLLSDFFLWSLKLSIIFTIARLSTRSQTRKSPPATKSIKIVVLGDIGRSPRMQYHAISFADAGLHVDLVGYTTSKLHPEISTRINLNVIPLRPFPNFLTTKHPVIFLLLAPVKVLFQLWSIWEALYLRSGNAEWLLVQNPPAIPTLAVAVMISRLQHMRLLIDWHNLGFSILALKLGPQHFLVKISRIYEDLFSRLAHTHICVTHAMAEFIRNEFHIRQRVFTLCDRPASIFKPLSRTERDGFLKSLSLSLTEDNSSRSEARSKDLRIPMTANYLSQSKLPQDSMIAVQAGSTKLVVSPTSWTPDEDFGLLLESLMGYSRTCQTSHGSELPELLVVITGKGPNQLDFEKRTRKLYDDDQLFRVNIMTAFFDDMGDYARLLGCADLGISLHTSSSGVDLPMKVLDMYGAALPVAGWSAFKAWSELVQEGINGLGFDSALVLQHILENAFANDSNILHRIQKGAAEEGKIRWNDEWEPVFRAIFNE